MKKILLIALLLTIGNSHAQDINKICDSYITHVGGIQNMKKIQNISIEQVGYSNNYEIPQNIMIIKDKALYQETAYANGKHIVSISTNKGWEINPFVSSKKRDLSDKEIEIYNANMNLFGPLYDYRVNGSNSKIKEITVDGEKQIDKDMCYKLKVTYKNSFTDYIYLSKQTYMVRGIENSIGTIVYSNYKKVNNIMFPFNSEVKNNLGVMLIDVTNLKTNVKIPAKLFEKS